MAARKEKVQPTVADVTQNGNGRIHALEDFASAETAAPEQDLLGKDTPVEEDPEGWLIPENFSPAALTTAVEKMRYHEKPLRDDFVKVHPADDTDPWVLTVWLYRYEGSNTDLRGTYLVHPTLQLAFGKRVQRNWLYAAISTTRYEFVWGVKDSPGRGEEWTRSALAAVEKAKTSWVSVQSGVEGWDAEVWKATLPQPAEPIWSPMTLRQRMMLAFKAKSINTLDHPVCKSLQL